MKKVLIWTALVFAIFSFVPKNIEARSGCCSHHGGVCGCGCCDGSPLSSTCAPYYPQCSQPTYVAPAPTKAPVYTPKPSTPKPTIIPTPTPTPTATPEVTPIPTESTSVYTNTPTPSPTATTLSSPTAKATTNSKGVLFQLWNHIKKLFRSHK